MSFTRYYDDPCRIKKQLQESTGVGRYQLNVPGNSRHDANPDYMEDPHYRLQKWGGNKMTNVVELESNLKGLHERLCKDDPDKNVHLTRPISRQNPQSYSQYYRTNTTYTEQSRATHPAWTYLDQDHTRWETLHVNPQENTELKCLNNLNTRTLEKDNFVPEV
jgi:hypothetical protein